MHTATHNKSQNSSDNLPC